MTLRVEGLSYAYSGAAPVFRDVSLAMGAGERIGIFGPNGAGKSTLARCLAGWLTGQGDLLWDRRPWPDFPPDERAHLVQLVDQDPRLQLSGRAFTVRDEIAFGPENLCLERGEIGARVDEALAALDLEALAHRDPTTLSGGETQRVILAGALAMRPRLLVLDQPSTDLDAQGCALLANYLAALPAGIAVVVIDTGPHRWLIPLVSRVFVLDRQRLVEVATASDIRIYRTARLALPDGMNAFLDGQDAEVFSRDLDPPTSLDATVELFRRRMR